MLLLHLFDSCLRGRGGELERELKWQGRGRDREMVGKGNIERWGVAEGGG